MTFSVVGDGGYDQEEEENVSVGVRVGELLVGVEILEGHRDGGHVVHQVDGTEEQASCAKQHFMTGWRRDIVLWREDSYYFKKLKSGPGLPGRFFPNKKYRCSRMKVTIYLT